MKLNCFLGKDLKIKEGSCFPMEPTTAELTKQFIDEHSSIKSCLKKGIVNYSSLARLIARELQIEKKTSKEAILIASRRYRESLVKDADHEKHIKQLLSNAELVIKNKIGVFIVAKNVSELSLEDIEKKVRSDAGTFYFLEGTDNYTFITQEKYSGLIKQKCKHHLLKQYAELAIIIIKTPKELEQTKGVLSYLTSLFTEHDVNIVEFLSCWTDTLFVIEAKDVNATMRFLKFS